MLNLLFSLIFYIINFIAQTLLSPILLILNIFSGEQITTTSSAVIQGIYNFMNVVVNYILFAVDILCIPRSLFVFVFTITLSLITFVIGIRVVIFGIAIYRHFKP